MKVFLTGSTGFVGSHVARAYADQNADLRLLTRKTSNLSELTIFRLKSLSVILDSRSRCDLRCEDAMRWST